MQTPARYRNTIYILRMQGHAQREQLWQMPRQHQVLRMHHRVLSRWQQQHATQAASTAPSRAKLAATATWAPSALTASQHTVSVYFFFSFVLSCLCKHMHAPSRCVLSRPMRRQHVNTLRTFCPSASSCYNTAYTYSSQRIYTVVAVERRRRVTTEIRSGHQSKHRRKKWQRRPCT